MNLDGVSPSFANVTFSTGSYTLGQQEQSSGGTLHLLAGGPGIPATLTVAADSDTISAPVSLDSNVIAAPAAGSQLTISGEVAAPAG